MREALCNFLTYQIIQLKRTQYDFIFGVNIYLLREKIKNLQTDY